MQFLSFLVKFDIFWSEFRYFLHYYGTEGYGVDFGIEQYDRMAELARTIKGKMVISVNDIPEMRKAFAGLNRESVDITYTVGGQGKANKTAELIIRNW